VKLNELYQYIDKNNAPVGLTIGNFDGVHIGHQAQIKAFCEHCDRLDLVSVLITFRPHPRLYFKESPFLINRYSEKMAFLKKLGVQNIIELDFNEELTTVSAHSFLESILLEPVKLLFTGEDFVLGGDQKSALDIAKGLCDQRGIHFEKGEVVYDHEKRVSSTLIRDHLAEGDISSVNRLLNYSYFIQNNVVNGKGKGKTIGFATANLKHDQTKLIPKDGVYAGFGTIDGQRYKAAINIGYAPTLGGLKEKAVEVHLLEASIEIYNKILKVEFVERIRDEKKFDTVSDLQKQIKVDITKIVEILND
jgi:riboflavin kinase/FMN adenylyltransferase